MHILIVDDQRRTRQSLTALLRSSYPNLHLYEAANSLEALRSVQDNQVDLVIMDARMPEIDGIEATMRIKARWPEKKILILSMYPEYQEAALQSGADAFVSKGEPADRLLSAIREVLGLEQG